MTDDEIRNAFRHQPKAAAFLIVCGYAFLFTHADFIGSMLFTLGILAIALTGLLVEHAIKQDRWWTLPSIVFAVVCGFLGAFATIISVAPHLFRQ